MKRIMAVIIVAVILMAQFVPTAFAGSIRAKKVVSVVYDDSNSMHEENSPRWVYANYAMQSFVGMLNKEDSLYISYMSQASATKIDLTNKNAEVTKIREKTTAAGTPITSIENAFNKLEGHKDNNANTQYWLVVMTDGQFYNNGSDPLDISVVEGKLKNIAQTKMPNGTLPKVVFLSMCDEKGEFTPDNLPSNVSVESAKKADDIMTTISGIADKVSGRIVMDDVKVVDSKTIEVKSKLPLLSIGVLTQHSTASVKSVSFGNSLKGTVESNVPLKYPEAQGRVTDKSLIGNVAILNNGKSNIPAGTYTITFSEDIDKDKIKVLCEPAIELKLKLFSEGEEITDPKKIAKDSELSATAELYEMGTDNKIDMSLLPGDYTRKLAHLSGGKEVISTEEGVLEDIKIGADLTTIEAEINVDDFFSFYQKIEFKPADVTIVKIDAEPYYDGSERLKDFDGKTHANDVVYADKLKNNRTGILYTLYTKDGPIDAETAKGLSTAFKNKAESKISPLGVEVQDDGKILLYPKKPIIYSRIIYWLRLMGDQPITGVYGDASATGTVNIKISPIGFLIELWILIMILRTIITCIFRKTFGKVKIRYQTASTDSNNENIFEGVIENTVNLAMPSAIATLFKIALPIPIIPLILLLKPGKKKIASGLKAVPTQPKRSGTRFKLEGIKGRAYKMSPCVNRAILPNAGMRRNDNKDNGDSITLDVGSVITIELGGGQYIRIKVDK